MSSYDGENAPAVDPVSLARAAAEAIVGANDRVSPDETERLGIEFLQQLMTDLEPLKERSHPIFPMAGGSLELEDLTTPYEPMSNQVEYLIAVSFDSLEMLSLFLQTHGLPMVGVYPLIRCFIEATAYSKAVVARVRAPRTIQRQTTLERASALRAGQRYWPLTLTLT